MKKSFKKLLLMFSIGSAALIGGTIALTPCTSTLINKSNQIELNQNQPTINKDNNPNNK